MRHAIDCLLPAFFLQQEKEKEDDDVDHLDAVMHKVEFV